MKSKDIRVVIVDDLPEIRNGLAALIGGSPGFKCVGVFENGFDALEGVRSLLPDVVLMDIDMPKMNGIECTRRLKEEVPDLPVMMLTVFEDDDKIFQSILAGAKAYILKKSPPAKLLEAIHDLQNGGSPMSSQIARKVVMAFQQMGTSTKEAENLTVREQEILSYLAKGYLYKEIADTLFISVDTVRTHLHRIYEKLQVRSRTEAVLKFINNKYLP
ncbi:MAG: response regulator transcription factor [Candidatus Kryptoniota bacterium]